ncbi:MAG: AsmA family protein [Bryobacterales bacterium]|nr:AsmA family protein [Bryobacterales bacterium]
MKRLLTATLLLLVLAAAGVPFLRADRFHGRIHTALEQSLHRKVEINGGIHFNLWPGPGFSISNVVIHEDPAIGIEPFAYVASLDATVSLLAMFRGRWEISGILLDEPNVNLVKQTTGSWNIRPLLAGTAPGPHFRFPDIQVRGGRINLKFGDTKSVLYFSNADLDITADSETAVRLRFSMDPARTDRPAQSIGTLLGGGVYRWSESQPGQADLNLELERSALSEIVTLLEGRGAGMRGFLASRARVTGPLSSLKIEGSIRLEDIQRWELFRSGAGSSALRYRGKLDFPAGELDLETLSESPDAPFRLRVRGHSLQDNASWGALLRFDKLPVSALTDVFQFMNVTLPSRVALEGKISGVLGYSPAHGLQGLLELPEASVKSGDIGFQLREARFAVEGEQFRLLPATLDLGNGKSAQVEGRYSPTAQSFTWRTGNILMPVKDLLANYKQLLGTGIPLLDQLEKGDWRGTLQFEKTGDDPAHWTGQFALRNARLEIPGLASPVDIESATGAILRNRLFLDSITASAGDVAFQAAYRQETSGPRPNRFKVHIEEVDASDLEALFLPTLKRGGGFLRSLSFRAAIPQWLHDRRLEAEVAVDSILSAGTPLGSLHGLLLWDGPEVELRKVRWAHEESSGAGGIHLRLSRAEPEYRITAEFRNLPFKGGVIDAEGKAQTSGAGFALLRNITSTGRFTGRELTFSGQDGFATIGGVYEVSVPRGVPVLKLSALEASSGDELFTGQGTTENDGKLYVDLTSGRKKLRMAGTLWPFQLDVHN